MRNRCHWFQVQSEARIKLSPMDVEYDHLYWPSDHQLFIFREKLWIFLSVLEVRHLSLFTTFKKQFGLGRWKRGPPRITFHYYSFGNSRCTPCAHNDGLWYVRGVSKMCRCAGQKLILDDYYNDSYSFITTYVYTWSSVFLIFMKANVVANFMTLEP